MNKCKHMHGAQVNEIALWVCGQCYAKMARRPVRYGPVTNTRGADGPPQQITWMAEIRESEDGTTLNDFLRTMAKRYMFRCRDLSKQDAYDAAIDFMKSVGEEFGDPALDWSHAGAREMADEDMTYWDADEAAGANS